MNTRYRPRRVALRDGREVTLREIEEADASEIIAAFERLSPESRYSRFMQHKKQVEAAELDRGVHPRSGLDFVLVATVPAPDGIDIVGAAQYTPAGSGDGACEFAVTVAEDWRTIGLATALVSRLVRRARRDGYQTIEGWVLNSNKAMLALARDLHFRTERATDDAGVVQVRRTLQGNRPRQAAVVAAR
ncbi:MAG TPA: GNAT family N-acetyltransferase [Burkholderiaceae bacterium]|nr:GNAT family N-acetyltransferase [Burkholderiaceae bacterium]